MAPQQVVFAVVTFLHDLFTAVWVGGLIALGIAVLPAARTALGMGPQTKKMMDAIQRRLSVLVYVSIVGLVVTGILLSNRAPAFEGLFRFRTPYAAVLGLKHILVVTMMAIALYRSLALGRGRAAGPSQQRLSGALLMINMVLGIGVLLLTGFSVALASGPPPV
jgi:putative copper export protein